MLISENVPSVHETHLYKSRTDLSQSKNQHQRCAANSSEIVKGLGMLPNKYAQVGTAVHCLLQMIASQQANRRFLIFRKIGKADFCKNRRVYVHLLCLLFLVFHNSKRHFLKWKSAATAALSAQKRNGRTLSMAAKPFILTVDSVRLFCYLHDI